MKRNSLHKALSFLVVIGLGLVGCLSSPTVVPTTEIDSVSVNPSAGDAATTFRVTVEFRHNAGGEIICYYPQPDGKGRELSQSQTVTGYTQGSAQTGTWSFEFKVTAPGEYDVSCYDTYRDRLARFKVTEPQAQPPVDEPAIDCLSDEETAAIHCLSNPVLCTGITPAAAQALVESKNTVERWSQGVAYCTLPPVITAAATRTEFAGDQPCSVSDEVNLTIWPSGYAELKSTGPEAVVAGAGLLDAAECAPPATDYRLRLTLIGVADPATQTVTFTMCNYGWAQATGSIKYTRDRSIGGLSGEVTCSIPELTQPGAILTLGP